MTISKVQSQPANNFGTTLTFTFLAPVAQGDLLVAAIGAGVPTSEGVLGPPDASWTLAAIDSPQDAGSGTVTTALYFLVVDAAHAGRTTFVFTLSSSHSLYGALTEWFSPNGWPASPLDQIAVGQTGQYAVPGTVIDSGTTLTTHFNSELWIAALAYRSAPQPESAITPGWVRDQEATNNNITLTELYVIATSSGRANVNYQVSGSFVWSGCVAALRDIVPTVPKTPLPIVTGPPGVPQAEKYTASYSVRVVTSTRQVAGAVTGFRKLSYVKRYNNVSDWAIELDANDPNAANLLLPGNGLSIARTVYNIKTQQAVSSAVEVAGPTRVMARSFANNTLTVSGKDYLFYLMQRLAWPVTTPPFFGDVTGLGTNLKLYWRMDATSGTSETDRSGNSNTGTYSTVGTGSYTLNQPAVIDDADPSVKFIGSSSNGGKLQQSATKTPTTVTGTFTVFAVVPAGTTGTLLGSRGTAEFGFDMQLPAAGNAIHADIGNGTAWITTTADVNPITLPTSGPLVICYVVTPTSWTAYLNGTQVGTGTYASATPVLWDSTHTFCAATSGLSNDTFLNGNLDEVFVYAGALTATQVSALSADALSRFSHAAYDMQTGAAETVIKHYVSVNVGASAGYTERQLSGLTVAADSGRGASVSASARFDTLVRLDGSGLLQQLALVGGIGLAQSMVNGVLTFDVVSTADRTGSIVFAQNLSNISDFSWERDAPDPTQGGNAVIVGGGQQGTARIFQIRTDTPSITTWGRTEFFLDARDTTDVPTMQQRGDAQLLASKEVQKFSLALTPNEQMAYGVNFFLGDKVTAVIDGQVYQDLIREVDVTVDANGQESVTPIMGTPNAVLVDNASIALSTKLQRQVSTVAKLQNRT